ncbi:MAG: rod-binding protein [Marinosulfonomonas sp.]|nr:rod-binding protein [Marinosulfonomonas sp.]
MNPTAPVSLAPSGRPTVTTEQRDAALFQAAQDLEASFLAEMLKSAGLGKPRDAYGGGIGEDQFGSFLRQEQAKEMVKQGGIGLAESLYEALKERADAQ